MQALAYSESSLYFDPVIVATPKTILKKLLLKLPTSNDSI